MAINIEEITKTDEIKFLPNGAIEVLKGTYYIKTITPEEDGGGESVIVTEDRISNWRGSINLHNITMAEHILGEDSGVAIEYWKKFPTPPVPELQEIDPPTE
jgi:hypothetical protein